MNAKDQKRRTWRELTESKAIIKIFGEKAPTTQEAPKQERIPSKEKASEAAETKSDKSENTMVKITSFRVLNQIGSYPKSR